MNGTEAQKQSIRPIARIVSWAQTGIDPLLMGLGPVTAVEEVVRYKKSNKFNVPIDLDILYLLL